MYVCMYVRMFLHMYVCTCDSAYMCMYVYACMHVYTYTSVRINAYHERRVCANQQRSLLTRHTRTEHELTHIFIHVYSCVSVRRSFDHYWFSQRYVCSTLIARAGKTTSDLLQEQRRHAHCMHSMCTNARNSMQS